MATLHRTVVRPIVTEKTSIARQDRGEYVFEVAPDASKPAIRQGVSCTKRDSPSFPREAIRAQVQRGRVNAVLTIDEKGNVTDVRIASSDPPRVFDRTVRDTLAEWKCAGEGAKYQASVEINFTLKDE